MPLGSSFICIYNTPAHPPHPTECPESIFFAARCRLALAAAAYKSRRAFSNAGQSSISFSPPLLLPVESSLSTFVSSPSPPPLLTRSALLATSSCRFHIRTTSTSTTTKWPSLPCYRTSTSRMRLLPLLSISRAALPAALLCANPSRPLQHARITLVRTLLRPLRSLIQSMLQPLDQENWIPKRRSRSGKSSIGRLETQRIRAIFRRRRSGEFSCSPFLPSMWINYLIPWCGDSVGLSRLPSPRFV